MPYIYKNMLKNILQELKYTDASKTKNGAGLAIITNNQTITYKLPSQASIFTAEGMAIYKVIKFINTEYTYTKTKFIILTDSPSNLVAITNIQNPTDITKLIQEKTYLAGKNRKQIHFIWIPDT